jgi:hypothetical protein
VVNGRRATKDGAQVGFIRLLLTVIGLAVAGATVGLLLFWWTARPADVAREPIPVSIGNASFRIPRDYVRAGAMPRPGAQDRVDLVLAFPGMAPAGSLPPGPDGRIYLALLREDGVLDPAERVNEIYGRFFEPDIWQNPGGLLLRRFAADSPYGDEELFLSPPDGRIFAARCRKPPPRADGMRGAGIGDACLWRFRTNGADVQVRFSPDLLPQWEALAEGARAKAAEWRAN